MGTRAGGEALAPEALADFLRELREGVEDGLDPGVAAESAAGSLPARLRIAVEGLGERLRGRSHPDRWGFDERLAEAIYPVLEALGAHLWRIRVAGVRNLPAHGRALLVANHTGSLFPLDGVLLAIAIMSEHPLPRWPRFGVVPWALALPLVSTLVRGCGGVPADAATARAVLAAEHPLVVFPEGLRGLAKPVSERGRVQSFDDAFAAIAAEVRAPVVPVALTAAPSAAQGSWRRVEFCEPLEPGPGVAATARTVIQERIDRRVLGAALLGTPPFAAG